MDQPTQDNIARMMRVLLREIGDDPNRTGLADTPKRVAKMFGEIFRGYDPEQFPTITTFPNNVDGVNCQTMILDSSYFFSHCEHHMVPFFGKYWLAYIPKKKIIGASKISRVVDYFAAKLQVQERLTLEIVNCLEKTIDPQGLILTMRARHLCKEMRGNKKFDSPFETTEARGLFLKNQNGCKDEFMSRIQTL